MSFIRRIQAFVPAIYHLLAVTGPLLLFVGMMLWLFGESITILGSARSYSEANSNWSKNQKEAVFQLLRYAGSADEADFERYKAAIAVPLAFKRFRDEMQKPEPDMQAIRQALRDGLTHPDDMEAGIEFLRRFRHIPPMPEVIDIWGHGDGLIEEITRIAGQLREASALRTADKAKSRELHDRLLAANEQLTPMSQEFTRALGAASRKTQTLLVVAMLIVTGLLLPLAIYLSHRTLRRGRLFEHALKASEERFDLAVTGTRDGLWDWNIATGTWYFSLRFKVLLGYTEQELEESGPSLAWHLHEEDRARFESVLRAHVDRSEGMDVEARIMTKGGEYRWFRVRGQTVRDAAGNPVRMAGALTDISRRKQAAAELFAEKERAQVTLASIGDGVITTGTSGRIEYLNPIAEQLTGWKIDAARGLPLTALFRLIDEQRRRPVANPAESVLLEQRPINDTGSSTLLERNDGSEIPIAYKAAPMRDSTGNVVGVTLVLRDMSLEREYATKLAYQASHDALTGLANRTEFERCLDRVIESTARSRRRYCVMYIDLDQFKIVNDTCGHAAGDELMRQLSALLQHRLRAGDVLARLGGDEFGVLLENCPPDKALQIAESLRQATAEFRFVWAGKSFSVGASIGLVNVEDDPFTSAEVMRAADTACYMAKEKGRDRVQVYRATDTEITARKGEIEWVVRLTKALEENRFVLYAQDIVPAGNSAPAGVHCELLVRMLDEEGKLVPPMSFIPAAERYNLMQSIDRWVLSNALAALERLQADGGEPVTLCAINLSGASVGDERFLEFAREQIQQFRGPRETVCFEITETTAITNLDKATHFIEQLKIEGCKFSLDDFGAGMSSFAYLKHLPVDYLKIDGGFVKDMADDPIDRAMVVAINNIGHVMGKQTIAEFVHNEQVLAALLEIGVDYVQGYAVAKPRPFAPRFAMAPVV
ncbi:MAG: EAL domain-containing protein [Burkholderiales bacterium]